MAITTKELIELVPECFSILEQNRTFLLFRIGRAKYKLMLFPQHATFSCYDKYRGHYLDPQYLQTIKNSLLKRKEALSKINIFSQIPKKT